MNCCTEIAQCLGDSTCSQLHKCVVDFCSNDQAWQACVRNNCMQFFNGVTYFNIMGQCFLDHCRSLCSPDGGSWWGYPPEAGDALESGPVSDAAEAG